jgi:hypothetical protein
VYLLLITASLLVASYAPNANRTIKYQCSAHANSCLSFTIQTVANSTIPQTSASNVPKTTSSPTPHASKSIPYANPLTTLVVLAHHAILVISSVMTSVLLPQSIVQPPIAISLILSRESVLSVMMARILMRMEFVSAIMMIIVRLLRLIGGRVRSAIMVIPLMLLLLNVSLINLIVPLGRMGYVLPVLKAFILALISAVLLLIYFVKHSTRPHKNALFAIQDMA